MPYQAEYIWLDGTEPTPQLRSKTKIIADGVTAPPIWGFDGSSTNQATGDQSDCVLQPVFSCPDPLRGGDNILVLARCSTPTTLKPHATNTRAACAKTAKKYAKHEMIFGIEQEYTMLQRRRHAARLPGRRRLPRAAGPVLLRRRHRQDHRPRHRRGAHPGVHRRRAVDLGHQRRGDARPVGVPDRRRSTRSTVSDQLYVARWLLHRIAEDYDVVISFDAKPAEGRLERRRRPHQLLDHGDARELRRPSNAACKAIGKKLELHVKNYGDDIESRLTGAHETAPYDKFSYGVSDRGASIRIPWQVEKDGKGYAEDRRPNANMDPYTVTRLIIETVCSAAE